MAVCQAVKVAESSRIGCGFALWLRIQICGMPRCPLATTWQAAPGPRGSEFAFHPSGQNADWPKGEGDWSGEGS